MKNKLLIAVAVAAYISVCVLFSTSFIWWTSFSSKEVLISVSLLFVILFGMISCGMVLAHFVKTNQSKRFEYVIPRHHIPNRNARCKGYVKLNYRKGI